MNFTKTKRLIAALGAVALMLSGCGANRSETVLRENIIPDLENVVAATDCNRALYEEIVAAAEEYIQNPSDETKTLFVETKEKNVAAINENLYVESSLGDEEKSVMSEYNMSTEDYQSMFDMFEYNSQELTDWNTIDVYTENGDMASLEATLVVNQAMYLFGQRVIYYGIMDLFAETGNKNIEYVRQMLAKYPTVVMEDEEWLTNHDEIEQKMEEAEEECEDAIDAYQEFINGQENELLDLKQSLGITD